MATVQLKNDRTYGKAVELLLEIGGLFQTRYPRKLMIGPVQVRALRDAGLLPRPNGARKRAKKNP